MSTPSVAVIIPAYNVQDYVVRAVESALTQTLPPQEIIVIDDGSTDATGDRVRAMRYPNVRVIANRSNQGPSASRNLGFRVAKSDWVALLDADDWWDPQRLENLIAVAQTHQADIVADNLWLIEDGVERPWATAKSPCHGQVETVTMASLGKFDYGILQPLFNRHFLEQFEIFYDESLMHAEDFAFLYECLTHRPKMVVTRRPFYYYRHRSRSLATQRMDAYPQGIAALKKLQNHANPDACAVLKVRIRDLERGYTLVKIRHFHETGQQGAMIRLALTKPLHAGWILYRLPWMVIRRGRKLAIRRATMLQGQD